MFIMPFSLSMLLLMLGLVFLYKNQLVKAKITFTLSILWLFLISYSPLVNAVLYEYEASYPTLKQAPKDIKYIYVLGGGHHTDEAHPITSQVSESSSIRLNEGIRLYQQLHQNVSIIVSGYSGLYDPTPHAVMQEKLACALGVTKEDLILHSKPRDTQEEAIEAKKRIGNEPFI